MVARKPGRYLAPVALIAVLVAVILLVRARTDGSHPTTTTPPIAHQTSVSHPAAPAKSFYVIKPGDTLSGISVKTKVSIATLESLNPALNNPNALQTGERIRLR